jgi:ubiquinone/menaquinone biosynthesis C-methylase UbiE
VNGLTHKFDKNNRHKLDNEKRRQDMPPVKTLEMFGFTGKVDMADIGCGIGYFTIPAAEITRDSSKIYALDITVEMLDEVEKRALAAGLSNVRNIMVSEYDLKLGDQTVGFALLSNVLHEVEDKKRYINEICRILQNGGKFAIIEWEKIQGESGPPVESRISYEEVAGLLSENGFESLRKYSIGQDYYGITAIKK